MEAREHLQAICLEHFPGARHVFSKAGQVPYPHSKADRAKSCCIGKRKGDEGLFIEPTLFGDVKDDMRIATEEIFGPVLCCMKWQNVDEVSIFWSLLAMVYCCCISTFSATTLVVLPCNQVLLFVQLIAKHDA